LSDIQENDFAFNGIFYLADHPSRIWNIP
jgi:hypothetical protein